MAIDDDSWLEPLIRVILERIRYFSNDEEEKVCLGVWWLHGHLQGCYVDRGAKEAWWGKAGGKQTGIPASWDSRGGEDKESVAVTQEQQKYQCLTFA